MSNKKTLVCPFCKALTEKGWQKYQAWFECGTYPNAIDPHLWDRSKQCQDKEVELLTTERDKAIERIKQLKEAGDALIWDFVPEQTNMLSAKQSKAIKNWLKVKGGYKKW